MCPLHVKKPLDLVHEIEWIEVELTRLNARRSLTPEARSLAVTELAGCTLLRDGTESPYYNRIKGFGPAAVPHLDRLLSHYGSIRPCFDMTPDKMTGDAALALLDRGYYPAEQLAFLAAAVPGDGAERQPDLEFELITEQNAKEFIRWIGLSNGGIDYPQPVADRVKAYFYAPDFRNYMLKVEGRPAAMGSLFLKGREGYLANDYTFEDFRGRGYQQQLIRQRLSEAACLGLEAVYTDVEFGSASHRNMENNGFRTVFINTFWLHRT